MYRHGNNSSIAGTACATIVVADIAALQNSFISGDEYTGVCLLTLLIILFPLYLTKRTKIP